MIFDIFMSQAHVLSIPIWFWKSSIPLVASRDLIGCDTRIPAKQVPTLTSRLEGWKNLSVASTSWLRLDNMKDLEEIKLGEVFHCLF
jgi:hypothetical protein